jgi:hypothetical protein
MTRASFLFFILLLNQPVASAADSPGSRAKGLSPKATSLSGTPSATLSNINNLSAWFESDGRQEHWSTGRIGLVYPRGTAGAIFSAGFIWAGRFRDGSGSYLNLGGQQYSTSTTPGAILGIRTGITEDPLSPRVRIWRIREDYATADLTLDASEFFLTPNPSPEEIDSLRNQYLLDWSGWPWEKGAPFYDTGYLDAGGVLTGEANALLDWGEDLNQNGQLDDGEDSNGNGTLDAEQPGLAQGDQVLWFVCNDIDPEYAYACNGAGIEQQTTIWAYDREGAIGETIFKRHRIIYKGLGTNTQDAWIDSLYLGQWTDADIGQHSNDFSGCDTLLSVGYTYNGDPVDPDYVFFGLPPPAVGQVLLQGPIIPTGNSLDSAVFDFQKVSGYKNLPMTEFGFIAPVSTTDYPSIACSDTMWWFHMLQGLSFSLGYCHRNPVTNECTPFMVSGDPVTQTGWIDGMIDGPGERWSHIGSGPVTVVLGDTQEVVVAVVGGIGIDYLNSITVMKSNAQQVIDFYDDIVGVMTYMEDPSEQIPHNFALHQNYPNPFNPTTTIRFSIPRSAEVSLRIFNLLGEEVATLVSGNRDAGTHVVEWDATGQPSGVYFYRLSTNDFVQTRKLVLLR